MERTTRTTRGISGTMIAMMTAVSPLRNSETTAIASKMPGIAINPSMKRMMMPSSGRT